MADVLNPPETHRRTNDETSAGINLVDLLQPAKNGVDERQKTQPPPPPPETVTLPPASANSFHLTRPPIDADLLPKNNPYPINPGTWVNEAPFHEYYENGLVKLLNDPNGRQQLGLRISEPRTDRVPIVPIGRPHLNDKGVALEFKLKF
ncbi:MAG TPA: hypothetical protein V6C89_00125 [Drouetiella sp.]